MNDANKKGKEKRRLRSPPPTGSPHSKGDGNGDAKKARKKLLAKVRQEKRTDCMVQTSRKEVVI